MHGVRTDSKQKAKQNKANTSKQKYQSKNQRQKNKYKEPKNQRTKTETQNGSQKRKPEEPRSPYGLRGKGTTESKLRRQKPKPKNLDGVRTDSVQIEKKEKNRIPRILRIEMNPNST